MEKRTNSIDIIPRKLSIISNTRSDSGSIEEKDTIQVVITTKVKLTNNSIDEEQYFDLTIVDRSIGKLAKVISVFDVLSIKMKIREAVVRRNRVSSVKNPNMIPPKSSIMAKSDIEIRNDIIRSTPKRYGHPAIKSLETKLCNVSLVVNIVSNPNIIRDFYCRNT